MKGSGEHIVGSCQEMEVRRGFRFDIANQVLLREPTVK